MNDYQQALKGILKDEGLKGKDLAEIIGYTYESYRKATMKSRIDPPKWVKIFVFAYNLGKIGRKSIDDGNDKEVKKVCSCHRSS